VVAAGDHGLARERERFQGDDPAVFDSRRELKFARASGRACAAAGVALVTPSSTVAPAGHGPTRGSR
jgi:hypothetical protein